VSSITALVLLMGLNVVNPEALVVGLNINRANQAHKIDAAYFRELSSDAAPTILAARSQLDPALWPDVSSVACAGPRNYAPSLPAFNWADAEAADARRHVC
jgi:hypothetical protein